MMWKIYLLGLLSNFQAFFAVVAVIIFVFLFAVGIEFLSNECWDDEVTYNNDKGEFYLDAYKKVENKRIYEEDVLE